jgi:hypothetical protein
MQKFKNNLFSYYKALLIYGSAFFCSPFKKSFYLEIAITLNFTQSEKDHYNESLFFLSSNLQTRKEHLLLLLQNGMLLLLST